MQRFFSSVRNFGRPGLLRRNQKMARPTYKPTAAARRKVAIAAGAGLSHEEIAIGLGISRNTLEKHFESELSHGAYAKRLEVLVAMHVAAKKGNVAAQKAYTSMPMPRAAATPLPADGESAAKTKQPAKGKKEQAHDAALAAQSGTDWQDLLPGSAALQ